MSSRDPICEWRSSHSPSGEIDVGTRTSFALRSIRTGPAAPVAGSSGMAAGFTVFVCARKAIRDPSRERLGRSADVLRPGGIEAKVREAPRGFARRAGHEDAAVTVRLMERQCQPVR